MTGIRPVRDSGKSLRLVVSRHNLNRFLAVYKTLQRSLLRCVAVQGSTKEEQEKVTGRVWNKWKRMKRKIHEYLRM